jgi:hypothetical protein
MKIIKTAVLTFIIIGFFLLQPTPVLASAASRDQIQNEVDPCLPDVPVGCSIQISICDVNGWYTCPIRFWGSMTSSGFRASGEWWPDGDSFSNFMDAGLDWAENYDIVSFTYSCGDWPPPGACSEPPPEEPPPEEPPPEEPPPDDTCPPGGDCECANIVCQCIEAVKNLVQQVLDVLEEIRDFLKGINNDSPPSEEPPLEEPPLEEPPPTPPPIEIEEIELDLEKDNPLQCGYESLFNKFPFDIMGDMSSSSANQCPSVTLLVKEFEVCWLLDLIKFFKYPLIIGFLIRILVFL